MTRPRSVTRLRSARSSLRSAFPLVTLLVLTAEAFHHHRLPAIGTSAAPPRSDASLGAATLEEPDIKEVVAANTGVNEACFVDDDGNDESRCVEFPPALTAPQRVIRALTFYSKVLPVLGAYKLAQLKLERKAVAGMAATAEEEAAIWSDLDEWGSTQIAETIKELRGFYVRFFCLGRSPVSERTVCSRRRPAPSAPSALLRVFSCR